MYTSLYATGAAIVIENSCEFAVELLDQRMLIASVSMVLIEQCLSHCHCISSSTLSTVAVHVARRKDQVDHFHSIFFIISRLNTHLSFIYHFFWEAVLK